MIKSETKGKAYIMRNSFEVLLDPETEYWATMIERKHAIAALRMERKQVRSDARDRAVRAFCRRFHVPECPRDWKEGDYFRACQNEPANFLKAYDNE